MHRSGPLGSLLSDYGTGTWREGNRWKMEEYICVASQVQGRLYQTYGVSPHHKDLSLVQIVRSRTLSCLLGIMSSLDGATPR